MRKIIRLTWKKKGVGSVRSCLEFIYFFYHYLCYQIILFYFGYNYIILSKIFNFRGVLEMKMRFQNI